MDSTPVCAGHLLHVGTSSSVAADSSGVEGHNFSKSAALLQAQEGPQRAGAHQEGAPGWGWTRFKMGSSGSCLWGQAHRASFTFWWRSRVEPEGRLDKWFLASRTTTVGLFKGMRATWLCRGVSVSLGLSPPPHHSFQSSLSFLLSLLSWGQRRAV